MTPVDTGDDLLPDSHGEGEARRVVAALEALESAIGRTLSELDRLADAASRENGAPGSKPWND